MNSGHGRVVISLLGNPKLESAGATDFFVARFDANGTVTDAAHGAGAQIDSVNGLSAGKLGEFYLTGVYGNEVAIGEEEDVYEVAARERCAAAGPSSSRR